MQKNVTKLPYRYVDHADRKVHGFVYVSAKLEDIRHIEPIQAKLDAGDGFIPADLGLGIAELQTQLPTFPGEHDHVFHEFDFDQRTYTRQAPAGEKVIDVDVFMNAFGKIPDSGSWDVTGRNGAWGSTSSEIRLGWRRKSKIPTVPDLDWQGTPLCTLPAMAKSERTWGAKILRTQEFEDLVTGFRAQILRTQDLPIHHMACGASRQHLGKTEHAMQLTTSAFKKAAKRYATRHTIPLNEGQQAFSEILGFKSTHDALLRLEKTSGPPVPKLVEVAPRENGWQSSDIFWSGLTLPQSHLLFETLMARPETWGKSRGQDRSAAKSLFRVALAVLELTHQGPIEASDVLTATTLEVILTVETQRREAHFHAGTTPTTRDNVLDGYVQNLVGYDAHKKRIADRDFELPEVSETNAAQHVHATNQLREFIAILKSIEDSGGAGMSVRKVFWCDLTIAQFKILVECLVIQQNDAQDRGRLLLRAVLSTMTVESITQINTAQLFDWVQLDNLDRAFIRTHDRNTVDGETKPQAEWAAAERPLIRYLLSLPGYDIKKIGKKGGQGDDTRLQHANVLGTMSRVFDLLTAIEATGGASACEVKRPSVEETNIREAINKLIATREHPGTSLQARAILHAAEVAELYPMDQMPARLAA